MSRWRPGRPAIDRRRSSAVLVSCLNAGSARIASRSESAFAETRNSSDMHESKAPRAMAAATSIALSLGLTVDEAIVLHDSNKLTLRLLPCDVLARVAPVEDQVAAFELDLAQRLVESGCPVAALIHEWSHAPMSAMASWSRCGPTTNPRHPREVSPADYATALERLHAGMRKLDVPAPHLTDRVDQAQRLWRAGTALRRLPTRTGTCSATRYDA